MEKITAEHHGPAGMSKRARELRRDPSDSGMRGGGGSANEAHAAWKTKQGGKHIIEQAQAQPCAVHPRPAGDQSADGPKMHVSGRPRRSGRRIRTHGVHDHIASRFSSCYSACSVGRHRRHCFHACNRRSVHKDDVSKQHSAHRCDWQRVSHTAVCGLHTRADMNAADDRRARTQHPRGRERSKCTSAYASCSRVSMRTVGCRRDHIRQRRACKQSECSAAHNLYAHAGSHIADAQRDSLSIDMPCLCPHMSGDMSISVAMAMRMSRPLSHAYVAASQRRPSPTGRPSASCKKAENVARPQRSADHGRTA